MPRTKVLQEPLILRCTVVLVASGVLGGCLPSPSPHDDVLPSDPNYPKLNANPVRRVMISGMLPNSLPVRLNAYYEASRPDPRLGEGEYREYRECYRPTMAGAINLHLTEPLELIRREERYEAWLTVDKYQPGPCSWTFSHIGYQELNTFEYETRANSGALEGDTIVMNADLLSLPPGQDPARSWGGPVDIWCVKNSNRAARDKEFPEQCGLFGELAGPGTSGVPDDQGSTKHTTSIFPDTPSVTVNFHDLDAEGTAGSARE